MGKVYAVITADIVGSRKLRDFRKKRDQKLVPISKLHMKEKLLLSDYAVTAWDEFQAILSKTEHIPRVILDLRRLFYPIHLWIAVGIGEVSEPYKKPVNVFSGGPAFERARQAADELNRRRSGKLRILTRVRSNKELFDNVANTIYDLHDALLLGITSKQWETINTYIACKQQQEITAGKLGLDVSTVSRNLKRGRFWEMQVAKETFQKFIVANF